MRIKNPLISNLENQFGTSDKAPSYFATIITIAVNILFVIATLFFFFNLILGGMAWMNSGGDKASLENARKKVSNNIIGIIIVFSTYIIVTFISTLFGINILSFDLSILQIGS